MGQCWQGGRLVNVVWQIECLAIDINPNIFNEQKEGKYASISYAVTSLDKQTRLRLQRMITLHGRLKYACGSAFFSRRHPLKATIIRKYKNILYLLKAESKTFHTMYCVYVDNKSESNHQGITIIAFSF